MTQTKFQFVEQEEANYHSSSPCCVSFTMAKRTNKKQLKIC
jgi:hypothetical protein